MADNAPMTIEEARAFFSKFYRGEHHIPGYKPKSCGYGWMVNHDRGTLATFDFNELTRLVVMAHDNCYRLEVAPKSKTVLEICIWKRQREGGMSERHPELEAHIESIREGLK